MMTLGSLQGSLSISIHIYLLISWTFIVLSDLVLSQRASICEASTGCFCDTGPLIFCQGTQFPNSILSIPPHTRKLNLVKVKFVNNTLNLNMFEGLGSLTHLEVTNSDLRYIAKDAFRKLSNLKILGLSHNNLNIAHSSSFYGLNLQELSINNNPNLILTPITFRNLTTSSLSLKSTGLTHLPFEAISDISGLVNLNLFNNNITELDPKFRIFFTDDGSSPLVSRLSRLHFKLIDLTKNPLHCTCHIAWLVKLIKDRQSPKLNVPGDGVNMICSSPSSMFNVSLHTISISQLPCVAAKVEAVTVDLKPGSHKTQMICTASGNPAPEVVWSYVDTDGTKRDARARPRLSREMVSSMNRMYSSSGSLTDNKRYQTNLTLNLSLSSTIMNVYRCTTWNLLKQPHSVIIRIRGPPDVGPLPPHHFVYADPPNDLFSNRPNSYNDKPALGVDKTPRGQKQPSNTANFPSTSQDYMYREQFSLLEMIGAVVGTFSITLALLLVISRCLAYIRQHRSKTVSSTRGNSSKSTTYWSGAGMHAGSTTAYSASGSQEYDVPRMDTYIHPPSVHPHHLPHHNGTMGHPHVAYQPARLDEIEFLDFKTQRKLYNGS